MVILCHLAPRVTPLKMLNVAELTNYFDLKQLQSQSAKYTKIILQMLFPL